MYNAVFLLIAFISIINADIIDLTDDNFEHLTQASGGQTTGKWLVKFYAPWCGHCKRLVPIWDEVSEVISTNQSDDGILLANVDCTKNPQVAKRFGVSGYPTIKYFADRNMYSYDGARIASDLMEFASEGYKEATAEDVPPPPSWMEDKVVKVRIMVQTNHHLNAIVQDFEEVVTNRKNAAAVLIGLGVFFGVLIGYLMASLKNTKIKKD
uniref:Thioredoxin domain-containing protein n=1 Tax=Eucampia antarctica TaxID=49252 RepID=A0A7S2WRL6_9STRA|mmetsp:Transcript_9943/g.9623  ORF Transcript_9943/g.9623 Transcript_9943/m.9623 type:complete len:210 (+) Transcript_9943:59-688(+)